MAAAHGGLHAFSTGRYAPGVRLSEFVHVLCACVRACVRACMRACLPACACVQVSPSMTPLGACVFCSPTHPYVPRFCTYFLFMSSSPHQLCLLRSTVLYVFVCFRLAFIDGTARRCSRGSRCRPSGGLRSLCLSCFFSGVLLLFIGVLWGLRPF